MKIKITLTNGEIYYSDSISIDSFAELLRLWDLNENGDKILIHTLNPLWIWKIEIE